MKMKFLDYYLPRLPIFDFARNDVCVHAHGRNDKLKWKPIEVLTGFDSLDSNSVRIQALSWPNGKNI